MILFCILIGEKLHCLRTFDKFMYGKWDRCVYLQRQNKTGFSSLEWVNVFCDMQGEASD